MELVLYTPTGHSGLPAASYNWNMEFCPRLQIIVGLAPLMSLIPIYVIRIQ